MNRISDRIEALRRFMQTKGISAFIVRLGNGFPDSPVRPVQL